jgi:5-formyltetrahydrofolate cyclo-ligase
MTLPLDEEKKRLRERMRSLRRKAHGSDAVAAARQLLDVFSDAFKDGAFKVVAGYWPIGSEMDPRLLMAHLSERNLSLALPVAVLEKPMVFRSWRPGEDLEKGAMGTLQPKSDASSIIPDLVLVPLLAFDEKGGRLGQGAGCYDRTLADLRRTHKPLAVGVAYGIQQVERVPRSDDDQSLDWVVTEEKSLRVRPERPGGS